MLDFAKIEKKWQKEWEKSKLFEANPESKKQKYFFTVPYPYASGPAHVGHARTYTLGDIKVRFLRLKGFNLLWPLAWHITGTPVLAIAKRIENKETQIIEDHKEYIKLHKPKEVEKIIKTFTKPENIANFYAGVWINDIKELGCSIDWRRQFTTGEEIYNKFIEWQYHHLNSLGYLVKGTHPVFYCPSDQNPVTTDDVKSGDTLDMSITEFYLIKMKFDDGFFVVATLRPETIYGTTNIWINPNLAYVKAEVNKEIWFISKSAAKKLEDQGFNIKVLTNLLTNDLLFKELEVPLLNKKVQILPAQFVSEDIGTGVAFSVPAHAPLDLIALKDLEKENKIKNIKPIGVIKIEGFSEIPAEDILKKFNINSQLEKEKLEKATQELYLQEFYKGVLNQNSKEISGLKVPEAKEKIYSILSSKKLSQKIYESQVKDNEGKHVKEVFCRDGTKVIVKVIEQWFLDYSNKAWKSNTKRLLSKISVMPEIYKKSFDSSIDWLHEWPCTRNRGLGTKLPYDNKLIIESLSDSTIYMAFYTIVHHLKENKIKPEQLTKEFFDFVFLGLNDAKTLTQTTKIKEPLLNKIKEEFSYWYPLDERRTAVMHLNNHLTFFLFHHAAIFAENYWPKKISLNEALICEGKKMSKSLGNVIPLVNAIRKNSADLVRLVLTSSTDPSSTIDWKEKDVESLKNKVERFQEVVNLSIKSKSNKKFKLDDWLYSKFYLNLKEATEFIEKDQFKQYSQKIFFETLNDMDTYISRTQNYPKQLISEWLISLTPLIPHLCEEFWHKLGNKTFISTENWPVFKPEKVNKEILDLENLFKKTQEDLNNVLKLAGAKKNAYLYFVTEKELNYFKEFIDYLKNLFKFEKLQLFALNDKNKYDPENKSLKAKFGKPAIYLE